MVDSLRYTLAAGVVLASPTNYSVSDALADNEAPIEGSESVISGEEVCCDVDIVADALFTEPFVLSEVKLPIVKAPKVTLRDFTKLSIPEWGVCVDAAQDDSLHQLRRAAMRRIAALQRRVKMSILTEDERCTWHAILDAVDYSLYSAYDMPYRWATGLLEKKDSDEVCVRWDDGDGGRETLSAELAAKFDLVDEGETFVARVKTIHYRTIGLDRISVVARAQPAADDFSWVS